MDFVQTDRHSFGASMVLQECYQVSWECKSSNGGQSHALIKGAVRFTNQDGSDAINAQVCQPTELIAHKVHCPPFCSPFVNVV